MSPYRTALPAPQKAPRASWWRRLSAWMWRLGKRSALRRCRHKALELYPHATWRQRQEAALLTWAMRSTGSPFAHWNAKQRLQAFLDGLGPCALHDCVEFRRPSDSTSWADATALEEVSAP